jgi:UDP-N-acetylglucosamine pyrophosphorylase
LASFNAQGFRRLREEELEEINDTNFEHAIQISRQRVAMEEVGRLLMATKQQRLLELNAHRQAEAAARKQVRLTMNEESRQWQTVLRGQRR